MRLYTVHTRPARPPVLVREGFSLWALVFGPFWLALRGAWVPAGLTLALYIVVTTLPPPPAAGLLRLALAVLLGFSGNDLLRWSLAMRGYLQAHVVAARDEDGARARLFTLRPDLIDAEAGEFA